jgi:outer membrane protein assembly factor BamA
VPYVSGYFSARTGVVGGQRVYSEDTLIYRELDRQVGALAFYPFNSSFRVEGQAGVRSISFDSRIESDRFDLRTGQYLGHDRQKLDAQPSLTFGEASLAVVRDTSVFGATAPLMGQRFRVEVSPTFGGLHYTGILADFRQYLNARPLTLALRVMHYGRYGSGGSDDRLYPLYIGYQSLLRGYDSSNFTSADCGNAPEGSCPAFDRLIGTKMAVGNLEVRAPLLALFGAKNLYGPLPIDIGAFFDAGVAWNSAEKPKFLGGSRPLSRSVGAVARMNMFGVAVLELDYVKPLDLATRKPHFQFSVNSGF